LRYLVPITTLVLLVCIAFAAYTRQLERRHTAGAYFPPLSADQLK
jgi:hypothetical protein